MEQECERIGFGEITLTIKILDGYPDTAYKKGEIKVLKGEARKERRGGEII